jgi:hypothetical protein
LIVASNPKCSPAPPTDRGFPHWNARTTRSESPERCWGISSTPASSRNIATGTGDIFWGPGSWAEFIGLGTPIRRQQLSQDYTLINVVLLPLFTIVD